MSGESGETQRRTHEHRGRHDKEARGFARLRLAQQMGEEGRIFEENASQKDVVQKEPSEDTQNYPIKKRQGKR